MFERRFYVSLIVLILFLLAGSVSSAVTRMVFSVENIQNPVFQTQSINIQLSDTPGGKKHLTITIEEISVYDHHFKNLQISCRSFLLKSKTIACTDGQLLLKQLFAAPVALQFTATQSQLDIHLKPTQQEHWRFTFRWDDVFWQFMMEIEAGKMTHLTHWLPENEQLPKLTTGTINGSVQLNGNRTELTGIHADLMFHELAFSDQTGMHAGEAISLSLTSSALLDPQQLYWNLHSEIHWQQGAVFWQPLFFTGSDHYLNIHGFFDKNKLQLQNSHLILADIGTFNFSSTIDWPEFALNAVEMEADNIALSALFDQILKPFLNDTMLADLEVTGHSDIALRIQNDALQEIDLHLDDVSIVDKRDRFAFHRIDAHIPWQLHNATIADISLLNGHVLRIPFGSMRVPLEINDFDVFLPQLEMPLLDGTLKLKEFSASFVDQAWQWEFGGELTPVSMAALTEALQIQPMHGVLSGYIPEVRFDGDSVSVNGVLQINIFDGSVVIHKLKLIEPLGLAPHLTADIAMRNLDLGLLTKTFSFGKVEGRVHIDIGDLELTNWKPIHFDAHLFSSPGKYTRRISQAAIQNISALGGEGAAMAIQRSFLRFFEEFSYAEIGWRCALRLHVCYMGGIESEQDARYTLVKGGGIPAINVMGYNREVGWQELVSRLQRITQDHDPIIQ